jgi:hypothetical protein
MKISDAVAQANYLVDSEGKKTAVVLPVDTWEKLLSDWERLVEILEDQEDLDIVKKWLEQRQAGTAKAIPLEALEQELAADGLL